MCNYIFIFYLFSNEKILIKSYFQNYRHAAIKIDDGLKVKLKNQSLDKYLGLTVIRLKINVSNVCTCVHSGVFLCMIHHKLSIQIQNY